MNPKHPWQPNSAGEYLTRVEEYKGTIVRLFPAIPKRVVDNWAIFSVDILSIGLFLEHYPKEAIVLDIGTFIGISTFCFATHPKVSGVISVDPNPTLFDELADKSESWANNPEIEPLKDTKVLDVARAAFSEFGNAKEKVQFFEGVVGGAQIGVGGKTLENPERIKVPEPDPTGKTGLLVLVDGLHTRGGIRADLEAVFDQNPHAIAFVDDCRHRWGPFVQAGIVDFMEQAAGEYNFNLISDLGPGLASSNFGLVYANSQAKMAKKALSGLAWAFSQRLDPLRLLKREEDLVAIASKASLELEQTRRSSNQLEARTSRLEERDTRRKEHVSRLEERDSKRKEYISKLERRVSGLEERNAQLTARYKGRRYKLVDGAAEAALRVPVLKGLFRRNAP